MNSRSQKADRRSEFIRCFQIRLCCSAHPLFPILHVHLHLNLGTALPLIFAHNVCSTRSLSASVILSLCKIAAYHVYTWPSLQMRRNPLLGDNKIEACLSMTLQAISSQCCIAETALSPQCAICLQHRYTCGDQSMICNRRTCLPFLRSKCKKRWTARCRFVTPLLAFKMLSSKVK